MTREKITRRMKQLAFVGVFAALVALGAAGAGVAGDPSQWLAVAGDPSQWGAVAGDPSQWGLTSPTTINDTQTALNFTKIV